MNLTIKATKTTLTAAMKSAVQEKMDMFGKLLKSEDKVHVELAIDKKHKTGKFQRVEITIHPHGHYAEGWGTDLYEALDVAVPKMKEQLTKVKGKKITLRRKQGREVKKIS